MSGCVWEGWVRLRGSDMTYGVSAKCHAEKCLFLDKALSFPLTATSIQGQLNGASVCANTSQICGPITEIINCHPNVYPPPGVS